MAPTRPFGPESLPPGPSGGTPLRYSHYSPDGHWYWAGNRWLPVTGPGALLLSDAERDRALKELTEHYSSGRLTAEEFSQRCEVILGARTSNELLAAFQGLPAPSFGTPTVAAHRDYPAWIAPLLGVSLAICGLGVLVSVLMFLFPGNVADARESGAEGVLFFSPLGLYFGLTIIAVQRRMRWARGAATVAAVLAGLSICGLAVAIPILWGLWKTELRTSGS
jgi:hypothetical protein